MARTLIEWEPCTSRQHHRLFHHLLRTVNKDVEMETNQYTGVTLAKLFDLPLLRSTFTEGKPRQYAYNAEFPWDFSVKGPLDVILPVRRQ